MIISLALEIVKFIEPKKYHYFTELNTYYICWIESPEWFRVVVKNLGILKKIKAVFLRL